MLSPETLALTYGVSSAITWGAGDFSGGFATRRGNVLGVIFFSQLVGGVLLIALGVWWTHLAVKGNYLLWGGLAGISGALGLVALYQGLALGRMGIVAPVSAVVTAVFPLGFALVHEGLPRSHQLIGFGVAMLAVWLLSAAKSGARIRRNELLLSLLAGFGFGLFFICIDRVAEQAIVWPLVAARLASVTLLGAIFAVRRNIGLPLRNQWSYIVLAGIFDTAGNTFFALASHVGRLDIAAVLASMYPASTVILARSLLKERLRPQQWLGVVVALVALALIAA